MLSHAHWMDLARGVTGSACAFLAVVTSWQQHLEYGLRIASLGVGILVGLITIRNLLRNPPQK